MLPSLARSACVVCVWVGGGREVEGVTLKLTGLDSQKGQKFVNKLPN